MAQLEEQEVRFSPLDLNPDQDREGGQVMDRVLVVRKGVGQGMDRKEEVLEEALLDLDRVEDTLVSQHNPQNDPCLGKTSWAVLVIVSFILAKGLIPHSSQWVINKLVLNYGFSSNTSTVLS